MGMGLHPITEIISDIKAGKMVILVDDEDRENEGDLIVAGQFITAEAVNFMARFGRGLVCLALTEERCRQLNLPLMVRDNRAPLGTAFTVSIEAAKGVTTGISAQDRARTILAAVAVDAKPEDIVQPGHIFPLMAQAGGVLVRAGCVALNRRRVQRIWSSVLLRAVSQGDARREAPRKGRPGEARG